MRLGTSGMVAEAGEGSWGEFIAWLEPAFERRCEQRCNQSNTSAENTAIRGLKVLDILTHGTGAQPHS